MLVLVLFEGMVVVRGEEEAEGEIRETDLSNNGSGYLQSTSMED